MRALGGTIFQGIYLWDIAYFPSIYGISCTALIKCMKKEVLSPIEEFCDKRNFIRLKRYILR